MLLTNTDNMEMIYYKPGELVELKVDIPYKPIMIVKEIKKARLRNTVDNAEMKGTLLGISCFWFTTDFAYQEAVFNTKDLTKIQD